MYLQDAKRIINTHDNLNHLNLWIVTVVFWHSSEFLPLDLKVGSQVHQDISKSARCLKTESQMPTEWMNGIKDIPLLESKFKLWDLGELLKLLFCKIRSTAMFLDQHVGGNTVDLICEGQCFTSCFVIVSVSHAVLRFEKKHTMPIILETCYRGWTCYSTIPFRYVAILTSIWRQQCVEVICFILHEQWNSQTPMQIHHDVWSNLVMPKSIRAKKQNTSKLHYIERAT